jgi:SAM-dependent methyltransferase
MTLHDDDTKIRAYWEDPETPSAEDGHLATLEAEMLARHVGEHDVVLDLGCGDGTGTPAFRQRGDGYVGFDRSATRLAAFAAREPGTRLVRADLRALPLAGSSRFGVIISQRALINLPSVAEQEDVLRALPDLLVPGGRLLVCEAFREGLEGLNALRAHLGSPPIPPRWHNIHLDRELTARVLGSSMDLVAEEDLSIYFFLTRVIHQALVAPEAPAWDSRFNRIAVEVARSSDAPPMHGYSTILLQVWRRPSAP